MTGRSRGGRCWLRILAAEISAGTFFGAPGEGYALRNFTYVQLIIGYLLARVVVAGVFIPAYYHHNVVSIYEFLSIRFGPKTRRVSSAVFLVTRLMASGTRLWVPTLLLVLMWQLSYPGETLTPMNEFLLTGGALLAVTFATAIYTTVGGIRAVIWTDVLQILVLIAALTFSLIYLISHIPGGWAGAHQALQGPDDWKIFDWGHKEGAGLWGNIKHVLEQEYTIWAAFLGSTFVTLATHGTDQDMVQRMLTAKNKRQSGFATILSGVADIPIVMAVLAIGILLFVYYQANPDPTLPVNADGLAQSNKVFPHFVLTVMPGGLRGLVIAGVLATTMGSLSTALNSLATSYVRDFHFRWFGEPATERGRVWASAVRHRPVCRAAHRRRPRDGMGERAAQGTPHHPHYLGHLRLYVWLAARRVHGGFVHEEPRQRCREPPGHARGLHRRGLPQRIGSGDRRTLRRYRSAPARVDARRRVPLADILRHDRDFRDRGLFQDADSQTGGGRAESGPLIHTQSTLML